MISPSGVRALTLRQPGEAAFLHDQRVVARRLEGRREALKQSAAVVLDRRCFPMHQPRRADHRAAEGAVIRAPRLMHGKTSPISATAPRAGRPCPSRRAPGGQPARLLKVAPARQVALRLPVEARADRQHGSQLIGWLSCSATPRASALGRCAEPRPLSREPGVLGGWRGRGVLAWRAAGEGGVVGRGEHDACASGGPGPPPAQYSGISRRAFTGRRPSAFSSGDFGAAWAAAGPRRSARRGIACSPRPTCAFIRKARHPRSRSARGRTHQLLGAVRPGATWRCRRPAPGWCDVDRPRRGRLPARLRGSRDPPGFRRPRLPRAANAVRAVGMLHGEARPADEPSCSTPPQRWSSPKDWSPRASRGSATWSQAERTWADLRAAAQARQGQAHVPARTHPHPRRAARRERCPPPPRRPPGCASRRRIIEIKRRSPSAGVGHGARSARAYERGPQQRGVCAARLGGGFGASRGGLPVQGVGSTSATRRGALRRRRCSLIVRCLAPGLRRRRRSSCRSSNRERKADANDAEYPGQVSFETSAHGRGCGARRMLGHVRAAASAWRASRPASRCRADRRGLMRLDDARCVLASLVAQAEVARAESSLTCRCSRSVPLGSGAQGAPRPIDCWSQPPDSVCRTTTS